MRPSLNFGRHILNQVENGITREWIETNGLGSYSMGTIIGANSRRYHNLFSVTVPTEHGLDRIILVNRVEESILIRGKKVDCSCQEYPGNISPQGHLFLENFSYRPFPHWIYSIDDLKIEKRFFRKSDEETSVLLYKNVVGPSIKLVIRPFFSCRNHHLLIREDPRFDQAIAIHENQIRCAVKDCPEFYVSVFSKANPGNGHNGSPRIYGDGYWYKNLVYAQEEERELDYQEDLYSPGQVVVELAPGQEVALVFSREPKQNVEIDRWIEQELFIRDQALEKFTIAGDFSKQIASAADQFVIRVGDEIKIIESYPNKEVSLRASLNAIPGLFLATQRMDEARTLLLHYSKILQGGMIPKWLGRNGGATAGGMDTPLWFIWAVQKFWEITKDFEFIKEVKPAIDSVIQSYREGVRGMEPKNQFEVWMDQDGLIRGSANTSALTWMNGQVGDWIVTPRRGKPVEIQALWYNALQFSSEISLKMNGSDNGIGELARWVRENFNRLFWNAQNNYLYDVIDGNLREGSIRPNALYAISMPYEILETDKFKAVIETAWKSLYTSLGLRTLATIEPHFHGICRGDEKTRVSASHNGSAYPFLIGPFVTAYFKTYGRDEKTKEQALNFITPFVAHLSDAGLGTISEVFDGSTPFNPRGCIASALSVAEILRVMKEEGLAL